MVRLVWRHGDPDGRLAGILCPFQDSRVICAVRLQVDIVVIGPFVEAAGRVAQALSWCVHADHLTKMRYRGVIKVRYNQPKDDSLLVVPWTYLE